MKIPRGSLGVFYNLCDKGMVLSIPEGPAMKNGPRNTMKNMWLYISTFICWLCLEASEITSAGIRPNIGL